MTFGLERTSVVLDDNDFEAFKESATGKYYFAERISIMGILNWGVVRKGAEQGMDMQSNGITTPISIESLFAFTPKGTSDEVILKLYKRLTDRNVLIGTQRISAGQMPYNFPKGIILPDMLLTASPTSSDATIVAYVKPVAISFEAVPGGNDADLGNPPEPNN